MAKAPTPKGPKRPAGLAHGRWLGDFPDLSAAERALVAACGRGEPWEPDGWDGKRPETATPENTIRGELIRFLALGGDAEHPVHEWGVMVSGGWIGGMLDLHQCRAPVRLSLNSCHFESELLLVAAQLPELFLRGSNLPGLFGDGLDVKGAVFLDDGFAASGEVRLPGARIGTNLEFSGGKFANASGNALNADGIAVTGDVFLRNGFVANGEVRLCNAQIGGGLDCSDGKFANSESTALNAQDIVVKASVLLYQSQFVGTIDLNGARIGTLIDDAGCWQAGGHLLDGLRYDRIVGPTDAASRITWLKLQHETQLTTDFKPQPWEQLIKVLREMGHPHEASEVAIAKQDQMRVTGKIKGGVRGGMHWLYGKIAGYGHRPIWTVYWMIAVWLFCAFFFQIGGGYGYMGPNTPLISNPQLAAQIDAACGNRREPKKQVWSQCSEMPAEYTSFQPLAYSADLILPLVNLQQESDWAPIVSVPSGENMGFGVFLRLLMWFEILFGWAASLVLVAVLGRLVEKD